MVVQTGHDAVANANAYSSNAPGMCLMYVRTWLELPGGTIDAITAWNNATRKHANGRDKDAQHPPKGAPVFWRGGSSGHGHIALAVNENTGRSTDTSTTGRVGTRDGNWWRVNWHMEYLGWTEDLNGILIPYLANGGTTQWSSGDVYAKKLKYGQTDSDSVARLCYRLMHHGRIPARDKPTHQHRHYGKQIEHAVRFWQRQIRPKVEGPKDGSRLSSEQANVLFGERYKVIGK